MIQRELINAFSHVFVVAAAAYIASLETWFFAVPTSDHSAVQHFRRICASFRSICMHWYIYCCFNIIVTHSVKHQVRSRSLKEQGCILKCIARPRHELPDSGKLSKSPICDWNLKSITWYAGTKKISSPEVGRTTLSGCRGAESSCTFADGRLQRAFECRLLLRRSLPSRVSSFNCSPISISIVIPALQFF